MSTKPPTNQTIVPQQAGTLSPLERFWLDTIRDAKKESPKKVEEAAKQLITITSLSQTIYFAAISFSEAKKGLALAASPLYWLFIAALILPLLIWVASLICAIRVFKPETYDTNLKSPTVAEQTIESIIEYKNRQLQRAYHLLACGFGIAIVTLFLYLVFLPNVPSPVK